MYQVGWVPAGQMTGQIPVYHPSWGQPPQPHEAGGSSWQAHQMPVHSIGYQPGWDQPPHPHEAGGSGWQSASSAEWEHGQPLHHTSSSSSGPPTVGAQRSFSRRRHGDIADLTSWVDNLDIHTSPMRTYWLTSADRASTLINNSEQRDSLGEDTPKGGNQHLSCLLYPFLSFAFKKKSEHDKRTKIFPASFYVSRNV